MIIDLHVHTKTYSRCSEISVEQAVSVAKERGLDGLCLMEHDAIWPQSEIEKLRQRFDYLILRGMEVETNYGHILVFGLEDFHREMKDIERLRSIVVREKAIMIAAHPFRTPVYPQNAYGVWELTLPLEQATKRRLFSLVDGLETSNYKSKPQESLLSIRVGQCLRLKTVAGSDAHKPFAIGTSVTVFNAEIRDEKDLLEVLHSDHYYGINLGHYA